MDIAPQAWVTIGVSTGCMTLAVIAVTLRFIARKKREMPYEIDDWITLLALFLLGSMFISWTLFAAVYFEGRHVSELTPEQLVLNFKALFGVQMTYTFTVPTVKISILLFYRRIFVSRSFQIASMILIWCCVAWFIAIFLLDIFQCHPVQRQWNRSLPGKCIDDRPSFVANGVFNILIDFATLLLPMPVIWKLHRSWQDRIALMGIFALGSFVCITGVVRTVFLSTFDETDAPYTISPGATWSFVEPAVGLVCGSLPTFRVFLPRFSSPTTTTATSSYRHHHHTLGKPSFGSSSSKRTADAMTGLDHHQTYEMMQGDEVPLTEARTDNLIRAERGEARGGRGGRRLAEEEEEEEGVINVQKEIIVT